MSFEIPALWIQRQEDPWDSLIETQWAISQLWNLLLRHNKFHFLTYVLGQSRSMALPECRINEK